MEAAAVEPLEAEAVPGEQRAREAVAADCNCRGELVLADTEQRLLRDGRVPAEVGGAREAAIRASLAFTRASLALLARWMIARRRRLMSYRWMYTFTT